MALSDTEEIPLDSDIDPAVLADLKRLVAWQCRVGQPPRVIPVGRLVDALDACGDLLDALGSSAEEVLARLDQVLPDSYDASSLLSSRLFAVRAMLGLLEDEPTLDTLVPNGGELLLGDAEVYTSTVRKKGFSFGQHLTMRKAFVIRIFGNADVSGMRVEDRPTSEMARALAAALGLAGGEQREWSPRTNPGRPRSRRDELLEQLLSNGADDDEIVIRAKHTDWLRKQFRSVVGRRGSMVLWGPAGYGKSVLVKRFGLEVARRGPVIYIDTSDPQLEEIALRELLLIEGVGEASNATFADIVQLVRDRATRFEKARLVIVDQLNSLERLAQLFPGGLGVPVVIAIDTPTAPREGGMLRLRAQSSRKIGDLDSEDLDAVLNEAFVAGSKAMTWVENPIRELVGYHPAFVGAVVRDLKHGADGHLHDVIRDMELDPVSYFRGLEESAGLSESARVVDRTLECVEALAPGGPEALVLDLLTWHPDLFPPDAAVMADYMKWFIGGEFSAARVRQIFRNLELAGVAEAWGPDRVVVPRLVRTILRQVRWNALPDFIRAFFSPATATWQNFREEGTSRGARPSDLFMTMLATLFWAETVLLRELLYQRSTNTGAMPLDSLDMLLYAGDVFLTGGAKGGTYVWVRAYSYLTQDGGIRSGFRYRKRDDLAWKSVDARHERFLSALWQGRNITLESLVDDSRRSREESGITQHEWIETAAKELVRGQPRIVIRKGFRGMFP